MSEAPAFTAWLDRFFQSYYQHRPVNATFIGVHTADHQLPDYSPAGVAAARDAAAALLRELAALPAEPLSAAAAMDRRLAAGFLRIQLWEFGSGHFQAGNPCVYTGEAAFGLLSLLRRPFAPLAERLDAAAQRAAAIPTLLAQGRANLRSAPEAWIAKAAQECDGLLTLLRDGLPQLLAEQQTAHPALLAAADQAASATAAFRDFLTDELPRTADGYASGPEAFNLLLREGHCLNDRAAEVAAYAEAELARAAAALREDAAALGYADWRAALAQLADYHPTVDGYLARYQDVWDACEAHARAHELLTWPEFPIRYVPRPRWVRAAAEHLYFLYYHAPPVFGPPAVLEYLVTPIDHELTPIDQDRMLRATNDSVIKLNHVVHHGAIGHHVQNWHAARAQSRVGQIAAVDCASRIAMFCGGTLAEGWACYATDLMADHGFLTPLERLAERQTRLRMCARALADVRIHHGEWTLAQAAAFYEEHAAMPQAAAHGEAVKNSMFPGTALMYLIGTDQIHRLRQELSARPGFTLRDFHDTLLSYGSVPVALIAQAMNV